MFKRWSEAKKSVKIDVENPGVLEVPEDKKFWQLPLSHFEKLVDKKGYAKIIRALTNLEVWNKNDDPDISKKASDIADKLKKKFKKESFERSYKNQNNYHNFQRFIDDYDKSTMIITANNYDNLIAEISGCENMSDKELDNLADEILVEKGLIKDKYFSENRKRFLKESRNRRNERRVYPATKTLILEVIGSNEEELDEVLHDMLPNFEFDEHYTIESLGDNKYKITITTENLSFNYDTLEEALYDLECDINIIESYFDESKKKRNESDEVDSIHEEEFTDRVDANFDISLYDYGVVRNPKNNMTLIGRKPNDEGGYSDYTVMYISFDDVKDVLEDMDDSFFRSIDEDKETVLKNLNNENLAQYIMDINFENGYWSDQAYYYESKKRRNEKIFDGKVRIFLTNLGKYTEGDLVGEWVTLPVDDFKPILDRIGINDEYEEWFITDYEAPFDIGEYDDIDELNEIAKAFKNFNAEQKEVFAYFYEYYSMPLDELVEKIENNDYLYVKADNDEDLGYAIVDEFYGGVENLPKDILTMYFDYEGFGRSEAINSYNQLENGYLGKE